MEMNKQIIGIYLAAGKSLRFGKRKLEQKLNDKTIGSIALETILKSRITYTAAVCSFADPLTWITTKINQLQPDKWGVVRCRPSGQALSLKTGLQLAQCYKPDAIIVFLADQPFISTGLIERLIDEYIQLQRKKETPWFISAGFENEPRPPVLFTPEMFPHLFHLNGDVGARSLIRKYRKRGLLINFDNPLLFCDIDTPQDLEILNTAVQNEDFFP